MLPKWKEVEPMVLTLLKDEIPEGSNRTPRYDPDDVVVWWNNAQVRLAVLKPQSRHQIYKYDDGVVIELPRYFYKPIGLYSCEHKEIPRTSITQAAQGVRGYYVVDGKLIITADRPDEMTFLYHSYFPRIEKGKQKNSPVHVPMWAHEACAIYVGLQAVTREAVGDARYRKFTSPEDAPGNPTHNPFLTVAKWMRERFYEIVNNHVDDHPDFREVR